MKTTFKSLCTLVILSISGVLFSSFYNDHAPDKTRINFPYKQAGLNQRQAAAHLLNRFTFGNRRGDIDAVVKLGLEKWFQQQLRAGLPDDSLNKMLSGFDVLKMSNAQIVNTFPKGAQVLRMAINDGIINKDSVNKKEDKKEYRDQLMAYMQQKGIKPQQELFRQLISQKVLRAAYTNNQLQEVLTDFWFNHFNVSLSKNDCAEFVLNYEKEVIRPNVLSSFEDLLMATAKSPAMLMYLDNFSSAGTNTNMDFSTLPDKKFRDQMQMEVSDSTAAKAKLLNKLKQNKKAQGLNENYAREVMELHTLGVDGGYTQQDVTQAARVLTGWTVYPMSDKGYGGAMKNMVGRIGEDKLKQRGFVHDGDFLFAANRHDNKEKVVLGKKFAAGGGYEEGVELLKMLAHHPSTAKFISRKIAVRFVNDNPPQSLIDKMSKTFLEKDGDIKQVLITMTSSPEFWSKEALREKTKSPFELAISSVRSLDAAIYQPVQLNNWITKMGQKVYFYQAPTGYPDKGQYWINTGALLSRMNFGLALASQRIPGVKVNLLALNKGHEPESAEDALVTYSKLIMPERDLDETVKRLTPLLNDPDLDRKVDEAAGKTAPPQQANMAPDVPMNEDMLQGKGAKDKVSKKGLSRNSYASMQSAIGNNSMLSQVIGIIIGSPEFQRK
ncbi:MAG: DUF1800 domain-containing protein [Segetibacter sp.]|nr:DUF1800 domain-containing protein [Segetibacter sp.]